MLETSERERLLDRLGLPVAGRRLILNAAKFAPVRDPQSTGGNIITPYQSLKMQRTVETESRHVEFAAAVGYEWDPKVLEYYPQPCRLKFDWTDADGEIHSIDHTPDFLVITEHGIWLDEWKPWSKLEGLARRRPWRYQLDPDDQWRSTPLEEWLAERGIHYRIRTDQEIQRRRLENILLLEDYLHPAAPRCPFDIAERVNAVMAEEAVLFLTELYEKAECRPDDVFKLIADGLLVADVDHAPLEEPKCCRVFRDTAVRDFEYARKLPAPILPQGIVDIRTGAQLIYNHRHYTIGLVGDSKVVLMADDGNSIEVALDVLEGVASSIVQVNESNLVTREDQPRLSDFSEEELRMALSRMDGLQNVTKPNRNQRRHLKAIAIAKINGTDELVALVPRIRDRGNRKARLTSEQEAAMGEIIETVWKNNRAAGKRHCHDQLVVLCAQRGITAPSYPTLIERINATPQEQSDKARHGKRVAYQNAEFVSVLYADTPVHGSRAYQYVHIDHTELDIELVSLKTGKPLKRPWLSIAIDAYTRRILGMYLTYDPPSYRSVMMVLRDMVRRYRRLPQFLVVDNGKEFHSEDFTQFCRLMHIHIRYRPAGQPRAGAVMERIFGTTHSQYIHNLAGNTKAMKNVRMTTGKFLPSRLAEWTLEQLYFGIEYWAFTYYDGNEHPALGMSPRVAFEQSLYQSGERAHRIVTLTQDFLILSCPTVTRNGTRVVDRQRGVKVHNNFNYWCPDLRDPKLDRKRVPVRYDPWDWSTVFVQIGKRWIPAQCKALENLGRMTNKERELLSAEYAAKYPHAADEELTTQRLMEFMRIHEPDGAIQLALDRQQENRELYEKLGIGPVFRVTPSGGHGYLPSSMEMPIEHDCINPPTPSDVSLDVINPARPIGRDIPDFDTF